jgi:hypothetical protein
VMVGSRLLPANRTNVNFAGDRIAELIKQAVALRAEAKALYERACSEQKVCLEVDCDLRSSFLRSLTAIPGDVCRSGCYRGQGLLRSGAHQARRHGASEYCAFNHPDLSLCWQVGVFERREQLGADYVGLQEMTMCKQSDLAHFPALLHVAWGFLFADGIKGTAAYAEHALQTGQESDAIYASLHEIIAALTKV